MKKLTIVFTKSKKTLAIGSLAIRLWTKKPYSHVAMRYEYPVFKNPTYYQASDGMVNYMSETQFCKYHEIIKEHTIEVSEEEYRNIQEDCHEEAGVPYGFMQNLGIVMADLLKIIGISIKNPFKKGRNCSELLYLHVFNNLGDTSYDPDLIKPHHIEDLITTSYRR